MLLFGVAIVLMVSLGVWCLGRIRREYRHAQQLSALSVAFVWGLYLLHFSITVAASIVAAWPISLHPIISWGAGIMLLLAGTVVFLAGIWSFQSFKRMSGLDNSKLVTTGIYQWSRNPQNVGWFLFLLGTAVLGQSGFALLLAGLFWSLFVFYVRLEEQYLERVFGDKYHRYMQWSHRYFGPPRKQSQI
jgi:protein-S-isoprenylcysteine O-methyltransferase Ste14